MELLRKKWHQLVVIGNGFDRECGLPSRFSDFASTRETMLESFLDSDDKAIVDNPSLLSKRWPHLTLWDILLANEQGLRWYDIEAAIGSWVVPEPEDEVNIILMNRLDLLRKAIEALSKDGGAIGGYFGPDAKPVEIGWGSDSMYHAAARYICAARGLENAPDDEDALLDFMLNELHKLESEFGSYLSREVERLETYRTDAQRLVFTLLTDHCVDEKDFEIRESVLSFNYTRPSESWRRGSTPIVFTNVHGQLGGEIVFGIDGRGIMDDERAVSFTKTYRIMGLDPEPMRDIIHPFSASIASGETDQIKFYGHSLSEADYSYFQALFDSVRLYEGRTRLIFYYRPHGDKGSLEEQKRSAREDMMRKVTRLLVTYGNTMDNEDHGDNLIHKLLLEGRLMVLELPKDLIVGG